MTAILTKYIEAAMKRARYELMEDGTCFAAIPRLKGLWANAPTQDECIAELRDVLEGWLIVQLRRNVKLPSMDGVNLGQPLRQTA